MAEVIFQHEEAPEEYPTPPANLSTAAAALDAAMLWQRLEAYIAYRSTERAVEWVVDGHGHWRPPLKPASIATVEIWTGEAWTSTTLSPSPLGGYVLPGSGPYRFVGIAGDDDADVPAVVMEAFRRLSEYSAAKPGKAGARSETITAGSISLAHSRSPTWLAEAMQNSGAADLLRNLRRA